MANSNSSVGENDVYNNLELNEMNCIHKRTEKLTYLFHVTCACSASFPLHFCLPNSFVVFKLLVTTYAAEIRLKGVAATFTLKWLRGSVVGVRVLALTAGFPGVNVKTFPAR